MIIESTVIETKVANISMDQNGILNMTIDYKDTLTVRDTQDLVDALIKICAGKKAAILVNSINYKLPSRKVRSYSAGVEASKIIKAVAFISTHPVTRIGANFFIKLNKPSFPFKIFSNDSEAVSWLKEFLK